MWSTTARYGYLGFHPDSGTGTGEQSGGRHRTRGPFEAVACVIDLPFGKGGMTVEVVADFEVWASARHRMNWWCVPRVTALFIRDFWMFGVGPMGLSPMLVDDSTGETRGENDLSASWFVRSAL